MIGFRDQFQDGEHQVELDYPGGRVSVAFGADGIAWQPTAEQLTAVTCSPRRLDRFERVERPEEQPAAGPRRRKDAEEPPAAAEPEK